MPLLQNTQSKVCEKGAKQLYFLSTSYFFQDILHNQQDKKMSSVSENKSQPHPDYEMVLLVPAYISYVLSQKVQYDTNIQF